MSPILIVEDDIILNKTLTNNLSSDGCEVTLGRTPIPWNTGKYHEGKRG